MLAWLFLIVVLAFVGKLVYDVQQKKNKPTQTEAGFDKDTLQKLAGIKPIDTNDEARKIFVKNNENGKQQIIEALLKAAENSEFPKQDETINVRTTKITTIDTNFGSDNDPLASVPMSRVSKEAKQKMAEIAKEDINVQIEKNVEKFATLTNQTKCGCGRSETGFCTGLHRIPKKAWAEGVRDIPAEKPKRKYTKKATK
jgi:predicted negative regulator of RcsB-dependent stress response